LAIAGDQVAGIDHDDVVDAERRTRHLLDAADGNEALRNGIGSGFAERVRLGFASRLGHGFREIREQHRKPQPERDLELEPDAGSSGDYIANEEYRSEGGAYLDHEHHRILQECDWIQLDERRTDRPPDDFRVKQRPRPYQLLGQE